MSDNVELAELSIKDLRHLAGEHHIHNRSRLGRDDLIQALKNVLASAAQAALPVAETPVAAEASAPPAAAPTVPVAAEAPVAVDAAPAPAASEPVTVPVAAEPAADPAAEPETLDAAAVAGLVQPAPGQPGEGGGRRRRRRRRRGGRNRDRNDDQGQQHIDGMPAGDGDATDGDDFEDEDGGEEGDAQPAAAAPTTGAAPAPAVASATAAVQPPRQQGQFAPPPPPGNGGQAPRPQNSDRNDRNGRQQDQRPQDQRQQDQRPQDQRQQDQRPPRPRIDGLQRNMPSVLDRLCTFTRGILELCDPSTPSWAQARLSELLAEAGMVAIPCQGPAHPDFHQVVGTVVAKDIPVGHIAVIESPGFALRGDRGDLFPQRKAQVRVSGDKDERTAPQTIVVAPRPAVTPTLTVIPPPRVDAAAPQTITVIPPSHGDVPAVPQTITVIPPSRGDVPSTPLVLTVIPPPRVEAAAPRTESAPRVEQPPRGEPRQPRAEQRPVETATSGDEAGVPAPAPRPERPLPPPQAGRDPHRPHAREYPSESPKLPLAAQDPAELALRPKAEPFRPLGLNEQILADVAAVGWSEPSPIQLQGIPVALTGRDMIGQAQTGTGKTGAFALPILQKLYALEDQDRRPVALVLCPTRELAKQVYSEFTKMAGSSGARATVIYGGTPMDEQFRAIERCPHIIIGTPGRIIDHMKRRSLDFSRLAMVVLDEADQMLDIGFWPDVQYIIGHTPPTRQILLFSATFPDPIRVMAEKHMKDPAHIRIIPKVVTVDQVDQKYIAVDRDRKTSLLAHFIDTQKPDSMLVFCRTKHQTDRVAEVLKRKNYSAGAIHGDLPQTKREKILAQFRAGELKCLIATNVAARGLDIPIVSHVVNYDIPEMPEEYVHRIGRTARNGAPGVARTFITPEDGQFLLEIEKHIGLLLEEERIEGYTAEPVTAEARRTIAETPVGAARLIKPITGGIRLGRRRR